MSQLVVPSMSNNTLTVIDLKSHAVTRHVGLPRRGPSTIFASPDGTKLHCLASAGNNIVTLDVATWAVDRITPLEGTVVDRARVPAQSNQLWAAMILQGHIHVVDTDTGDILRTFRKLGPNFTVTEDAKIFYTLEAGRPRRPTTFTARDAESGEALGQTTVPAMRGVPLGTELYDGTAYIVELSKSGALHAIDLSDPSAPNYQGRLAVGSAPLGSTFMPDGTIWLPNSGDGTISVVDPESFTVVHTIDVGRYVGAVTHYDGRAYVNVSRGNRLGFWHSMWVTIPGPYLGTYVTPASGQPKTRRVLDHPAEVITYDAATYERLPLVPLPLPSIAFTSAVIP